MKEHHDDDDYQLKDSEDWDWNDDEENDDEERVSINFSDSFPARRM